MLSDGRREYAVYLKSYEKGGGVQQSSKIAHSYFRTGAYVTSPMLVVSNCHNNVLFLKLVCLGNLC